MTRTELRSIIAAARDPDWSALESFHVSRDIKVMAEPWGGEVKLDEEFFNAIRRASWRRRFVSNDAGDLSRTAVTRAQSEPVIAAIPMRRARS